MWNSLAEPWRVCLEELWDGYCAGSVPHGAAVVGPDGRILARGRNRQVQGASATAEGDRAGPDGAHLIGVVLEGHRLAHAELIALLSFDPAAAGVSPAACALYTATEPCPLCAGATAMSGIRTLHFAARDTYGGASALLAAMPILRDRPVVVDAASDSVVEGAVIAVRVEYRLQRGPDRARTIRSAAASIRPDAVRLADRLFAEDTLPRLRREGAPASTVFSALFDLLAGRG